MAWIESHQSLSKHRKTIRTAGRLAVDRHKLIGHLHELWWWALDNVGVDGCLGDMDAFEIATAAEWDGDPEAFVEALIEAGFIDRDPNTNALYLHDWYDYAGKLIDAREAERERSRRRRAAAKKRTNHKETAERPTDDQRSTSGQPLAPNRTVPNHTQPERERESKREDAREDGAPTDSLTPPSDDLKRVVEHYHQVIGLLSPVAFQKLQFWLDEQGMEADVVCAAIDTTREQAERPGIAYLEGVLRNWRNEGVTTVSDLEVRSRAGPRVVTFDEAAFDARLNQVLGVINDDASASAS